MTENEAIDVLDELNCLHIDVVRANAIEIAIQALEEIQQYRAIGTVDEFKALKEKSVPKKLLNYNKISAAGNCPVCNSFVDSYVAHCHTCGQALKEDEA